MQQGPGREVFRGALLPRLPGLLPGRHSPLDLLNKLAGDFLCVVFSALPKGFLCHQVPPFLVVAVMPRRVDLRHGAHVLVHGHSDLLRQFPRQLHGQPPVQRLMKFRLRRGRGVLLAVLFLFSNHRFSFSGLIFFTSARPHARTGCKRAGWGVGAVQTRVDREIPPLMACSLPFLLMVS